MPSPRPGSNRNLPLTGRVLAPIELQARAMLDERARAPAEGIEPSRLRLTAGCLTIRLRWNEKTGGRGQPAPRRLASSCQRAVPLQRAEKSVHPDGEPSGRFRGQGSNLHCWVQRPASCRWTTPDRDLNLRRLGGDRTLASPGKSRVRCRYATSLLSVGGTQGIRTLIPPVKSRVPCH